jgi:hypothetical protein
MLRNAKQEAEEWRVAALAWADEAERLRGLETENERLRAALELCACSCPGTCRKQLNERDLACIAHNALRSE